MKMDGNTTVHTYPGSNNSTMANATQTSVELLESRTPSEMITLFIGFAIITANAALIMYFKKDRNSTWNTSFFLSNLALSDILSGVMVIVGLILKITKPGDTAAMCRFNIGTIGVLSSIMSPCCILMLSIQVSRLLMIWKGVAYIGAFGYAKLY